MADDGHVPNIGIAGVDPRDFAFAQIDARDVIAGLGVLDRQRQPDIPETNYANASGSGSDLFGKHIGCCQGSGGFNTSHFRTIFT